MAKTQLQTPKAFRVQYQCIQDKYYFLKDFITDFIVGVRLTPVPTLHRKHDILFLHTIDPRGSLVLCVLGGRRETARFRGREQPHCCFGGKVIRRFELQ